ncbi:MAG: hypothetical protein LBG83_00470 [Oscillospiraceae bacterium]|jgi:hypothetical protein|nr:hypothetical protein [Oscillospiraceae bacterium]
MLQFLLEALTSRFLLFALHLSNTGTFPPPLSAEEEQQCLLACAAGDSAARDKLIEHNLRLVVHVIKNIYHKRTALFAGLRHTEYRAGQAFLVCLHDLAGRVNKKAPAESRN